MIVYLMSGERMGFMGGRDYFGEGRLESGVSEFDPGGKFAGVFTEIGLAPLAAFSDDGQPYPHLYTTCKFA